MIVDELIEQAMDAENGNVIKDIRLGLRYTCVLLENNVCGLAYTFRDAPGRRCCALGYSGNLIGLPVKAILPWAREDDLLKASVGLAAINSVLNDPAKGWKTGNVADALSIQQTETFGMIGEFRPILSKVKTLTKSIYVFEQDVSENSELYPEAMIPLYLPKCDVVVITATSIINHTVDAVVSCCKNAGTVCLVGPSTPLSPQVFNRYGVTLLAGSVVQNPELMLQIISQGGGTMSMKPAIDQVLVPVTPPHAASRMSGSKS